MRCESKPRRRYLVCTTGLINSAALKRLSGATWKATFRDNQLVFGKEGVGTAHIRGREVVIVLTTSSSDLIVDTDTLTLTRGHRRRSKSASID